MKQPYLQPRLLSLGLAFALAGVTAALPVSAALANPPKAEAADSRSIEQRLDDARKEGRILSAYALNRNLSVFRLSADVHGNHASIGGTVDSSAEKELAEQIAKGVKGIEHVDSSIAVDPHWKNTAAASSERDFADVVSDATVTAKVKSRLLWNDATDGLDINVDTERGRVTLKGTADSNESKKLAGRLAATTDGVRYVDNRLAVGGPDKGTARPTKGAHQTEEAVSDAWITTKVKSSLLYSKNVDGLDITVDTKEGVVNLSGTVDSAAERDLAIELARQIRGVKKVETTGLKIEA
jgi:hyperosmotically inducible protein